MVRFLKPVSAALNQQAETQNTEAHLIVDPEAQARHGFVPRVCVGAAPGAGYGVGRGPICAVQTETQAARN
jgi:hypothetical protein